MDDDAVRLFDEDRQRFLSFYREFLLNPGISGATKVEAIRSTQDVLRQMAELIGPRHG